MGFRLPYYSDAAGAFNDPEDHRYFVGYAEDRIHIRMTVEYLAELWGLEAEPEEVSALVSEGKSYEAAEFELLKQAVMERSLENSRIVYRQKSEKLFLTKLTVRDFIDDIVFSKTGVFHEVYVVGEGGYAAVYKTADFLIRNDELEPFVGKRIWGSESTFGLYRFGGMDSWQYLVERNQNGRLVLLAFDRYITDRDSWDYGAFVNIYGVEPNLFIEE